MSRRRAREFALQILFQIDFRSQELSSQDFEDFWSDKDESDDIKKFAEELVGGTIKRLDEIDLQLEKIVENLGINENGCGRQEHIEICSI